MWNTREREKISRYAAVLLLVYAAALALVSFLVIRFDLQDSILYLFTIPTFLAAFYFQRRLYLSIHYRTLLYKASFYETKSRSFCHELHEFPPILGLNSC